MCEHYDHQRFIHDLAFEQDGRAVRAKISAASVDQLEKIVEIIKKYIFYFHCTHVNKFVQELEKDPRAGLLAHLDEVINQLQCILKDSDVVEGVHYCMEVESN